MRHIPFKTAGWLLAILLSAHPLLGHAQTATPARSPSKSKTVPQPDKAPAQPDASAAVPASSPAEATTTSNYVIGPGDTLHVFVWQNPELSVVIPVRPDGKISTPLVEDLVAVGKTPAQLARDIETVLGEYVRHPKVNIIVSGAQSTFSQVKVIGQVKTPESIAYHEGMTVLDLILQAGGLSEYAAGNRTKLIRKDASGKEAEQNIRLEDLVKKGRLSENISLQPGDIVIVPESRF